MSVLEKKIIFPVPVPGINNDPFLRNSHLRTKGLKIDKISTI